MRSLSRSPAAHVAAGEPLSSYGQSWVARHANQIAGVLLCCAAVYHFILIVKGWPVFDSDQAVIGLMARHIWLHGEHPLFFYGQQYMGSGEAYTAVPFFALFGSSVLTLRLAMLPLILLFLTEVYLLGRAAFGPVAALLALAWLIVGPSIAVYRALTTEGGIQEALVLSGAILLCAWARLRLPERRPHTLRSWLACIGVYALLGVASGLALWSDWLVVPLILLTLGVLLVARPLEMLSWAGAVLVLGFVVAAWPYLQFNFTHQFASLNQAIYYSGNSNGALGSRLAELPSEIGTAGAVSLPAVFGSPHVCVLLLSEAGRYRWMAQLGATGGFCSRANQLFSLLILALGVLAAWPLLSVLHASVRSLMERLRHLRYVQPRLLLSPVAVAVLWRKLDVPATTPTARHSAKLWLRGIMLANALVLVFAYINNPLDQSYPLDTSRYLMPLYLSAPLFMGALWEAARPLFHSLARWLAHRPGRRDERATPQGAHRVYPVGARSAQRRALALSAAGMLMVLLAFSAINGSGILRDSADAAAFAVPVDPPWLARILAVFDAYHVHTFYSDSYYDCFPVAFESNERQVCAVLGTDGQPETAFWINRYAPYLTAVAGDPHHAYLLTASDAEQAAFVNGPLPAQGYQRLTEGSFAIYVYAGA